MSAELTGYTGGRSIGAARQAGAGGALSTQELSFDQDASTWDALPAGTRDGDRGRGEVLAESIDDATSYSLRVDGVPHQVRTAWRAYPDRIFLARAVRPLVSGTDGRSRPAGPWLAHDSATHTAVGSPTKTYGVVPADVSPSPSGIQVSGPQGAVPAEQRAALDVFSVLPPAVRAGAASAVPEPTTWLGGMSQFMVGAQQAPVRHTLQLLRMDAETAVVIVASRELAAHLRTADADTCAARLTVASWDVTQYVYRLGERREQLGGRKRLRIGGRR